VQLPQWLGPGLQRGPLRGAVVPWLSQPDFDRLLWSADLNLVRGEDSFVRAQWAGVPFIWQIYVQHDGAHAAKLEAFLRHHLAGAPAPLRSGLQALWRGWNGLAAELPAAPTAAGALPAWAAHCRAWRDLLLAQPDLVTQLLAFVAGLCLPPAGRAPEQG
jgi:uncharacterized repeat protein (TIGR03837 family)